MASFDLKRYLSEFDNVCQKRFGRTYNLKSLEKDFAKLQRADTWLSATHVMALFDPNRTPYARWWAKPHEKDLDKVLKQRRVVLGPWPESKGAQRDLVQRLLEALHSMGLASLALRFVYPEHCGIFSTPVLYLLLIHHTHLVDLYLAFCEELREWRRHFGMQSVAETETALWTFHAVAGSRISAEAAAAQASFDSDIWIQRHRVHNALHPFFSRYGPLELARILAEEDCRLAGKIAGEEFERLLRLKASDCVPTSQVSNQNWMKIAIDFLAQRGRISIGDKTILHRVRIIRNRAVHSTGGLELAEIENMIDDIERICSGWEIRAPAKPGC